MNVDNFFPENTSLDAVTALQWDQLDAVLADFPDPWLPRPDSRKRSAGRQDLPGGALVVLAV